MDHDSRDHTALTVILTALGILGTWLAIPQVSPSVCNLSGFLCPPVQAEDVSLRFFVKDKYESYTDFHISEPDRNRRIYGNRFPVETPDIYLDLSFRHRSVRLFSDFTIHPICFFGDSSDWRPIDCSILNFTLDPDGGRNILVPKENVFQKSAVLLLNIPGTYHKQRGRYQIILEIGGDGEALAFMEVEQEFSLF